MKKILLFTAFLILGVSFCNAQFQQRTFKISDTTGLADIEDKIGEYEIILQDVTDKINTLSNLESIKQYANISEAVGDTLLNHIIRIFDGFTTLHADQGQSLKNICDLSENIMQCKNLTKAKKYNQKIIDEYNKMVQAK
jgi:hypothetical protein